MAKKSKAQKDKPVGPGDPALEHDLSRPDIAEATDDVAWVFLRLSEQVANHNPAEHPSPDSIMAAAQALVQGERNVVQLRAKPETADADKPKRQRAAGRTAKASGSRSRKKPLDQSAYCDCGDDCWQSFDEDYDGCDCDPDECRREYRGKDAGPCGCIKPEPRLRGAVVMIEDRKGNWRWEEQS